MELTTVGASTSIRIKASAVVGLGMSPGTGMGMVTLKERAGESIVAGKGAAHR